MTNDEKLSRIRNIIGQILHTQGWIENEANEQEYIGPFLYRILDTIRDIEYDNTGRKLIDSQ